MRARSATLVALAMWLVSAAAAAQSSSADSAQAHFDRGAKLYNLGHFQEAIPDFEKAYELDPSPIFLFNIAQSHRQLGNKERALFFYRRYLEQAPNAANREDVERRMKELQAALQDEAEAKRRAPSAGSGHVDTPAVTAAGGDQPAASPVQTNPEAPAGEARRPWAVSLSLGPAFAWMSGRKVDLPVLFAGRLEATYAFELPAGDLAVGVVLGYARLPYTRQNTPDKATLDGTSGSSAFWALLASARYLAEVAPGWKLGGGVGAGVVIWSGLDEGNPFTLQGVAPTGALVLPTLSVGLRAQYRWTDDLFVALTPELVWSEVPSSAGNAISGVISSVTRVDLAAGVGYAF